MAQTSQLLVSQARVEPSSGSRLIITPVPNTATPNVARWVEANDTTWDTGTPTFTLGQASDALNARGWVASTDTELLIRVDVREAQNANSQTGGDIWNGDALQISVDARGDGTQGLQEAARGPFGPDDAAFGFALTTNGVAGWTWFSGGVSQTGAAPARWSRVTRDEAKQTTRYDIRLSWDFFATKPGVYPTFGLAIQVNDNSDANQQRLFFGKGADGVPRPGLHEKFSLSEPPHEYSAAAVTNTDLWNAGAAGEAVFAVATKEDKVLQAAGNVPAQVRVAGTKPLKLQRYAVRLIPSSNPTDTTAPVLRAELLRPKQKAPLLTVSAPLVVPQRVYQQLIARLEQLQSTRGNAHPLFARHLRTVQALAQTEWARLQLYKDSNRPLARETLDYLKNMLAGFQGDAANWQTYLDGKRALTMGFISPKDATTQHYLLTLPKNWDANKAYPLFVELHGAGNAHPLNSPASHLGLDVTAPQLHGYETPKTFAMIQRNGYHIMPTGRGNLGYRDIGEVDVWEAFRDVHSNFKIDENRRYLYGFSMGGGGTWLLGARTPDLWAAIALLAPGWHGDMGRELGRNVTNMPTWIWVGEKDSLVESAQAIKDEMQKYGPAPILKISPDVGHNYLGTMQEESLNWMQQFTRKRPNKFEFIADTDEHRGVWGIQMTRDLSMSGLPRFTCSIEGNTVRIDSTGTPSLTVNLGEGGLGLSGDVVLFWNGTKVYEGPSANISLPIVK